jgi:hypothetical protein
VSCLTRSTQPGPMLIDFFQLPDLLAPLGTPRRSHHPEPNDNQPRRNQIAEFHASDLVHRGAADGGRRVFLLGADNERAREADDVENVVSRIERKMLDRSSAAFQSRYKSIIPCSL